MFEITEKIPTQKLNDDFLEKFQIKLSVLRLDLVDTHISGNKWFKLKYNGIEAKKEGFRTLLTFGGAYSNHIAATAYASKKYNFNSIGIIRGEEHLPLNPTLQFAKACGMQIYYMDRNTYREKHTETVISKLRDEHGHFYLIPEGGTNKLAIKGTEEIVGLIEDDFDMICCAAGTGGTAAGIINSLKEQQKALIFSALKGDFLKDEINKWLTLSTANWQLLTEYHFGGFAKFNTELITFIKWFKQTHHIQLEPIYTGKLFFGLYDLIKKKHFKKDTHIVAVHTGGLQGLKGFQERFGIDWE